MSAAGIRSRLRKIGDSVDVLASLGVTDRAMLKRIIGFIVLAAVGFAGGHLIRVMFSHEHPKPANESPVSNHN